MSGAGTIDVSGELYNAYNYSGASGGGGRVALYVDSFSGFDPGAQIKARGGAVYSSATTIVRYASPGTVFVQEATSTYGKLWVDQGGVGGLPIAYTPLPSIGTSTIGTVTPDTATPTALWIQPTSSSTTFALGVVGMWVRVGATDYRVLAQSSDRHSVLLAGAVGLVNVGDTYHGVYKFDEVIVRGGAKLQLNDAHTIGTLTVDGTSSVQDNVP